MKAQRAVLAAAAALSLALPALAATPEETIAAKKCNKCHTAKTTKKAPSFADLATKYQGQAGASARIVETLKTGRDDHDKVAASDAELKAIADWVLQQK